MPEFYLDDFDSSSVSTVYFLSKVAFCLAFIAAILAAYFAFWAAFLSMGAFYSFYSDFCSSSALLGSADYPRSGFPWIKSAR